MSNPNLSSNGESGLSVNASPYVMQAHQWAQSSKPVYYVTEPPESPKGVLTISKPSPKSPSQITTTQEFSPPSSPRTTKQNALVDVVLAHVFEDLNLKRKAQDEVFEEEEI